MSRTRKASPRRKRYARKLRLAWREFIAAFRIEARDLRERRSGGGPARGRTTTDRVRRGSGRTRCVDCHRWYGPDEESPWPNVCASCIRASAGGSDPQDPGSDQGPTTDDEGSDHDPEESDHRDEAPVDPTPAP